MGKINTRKKHKRFKDIKQIDENGVEYWSARDLYPVLGYDQWKNFENVIEKAKFSAENVGEKAEYHFAEVGKVIKAGRGADMKVEDFHLTRFGAYLVAMNGDPRKPEIALAQAYFAIQTRKQEIFAALSDEEKRLLIRGEVINNNKKLFETAQKAGVTIFYRFNNAGYMGLYGGLTAAQIEKKKGIPKGKILDMASTTELAANLFRITQTDGKLKTGAVKGQGNAEDTHFEVGKKVRETIQEIGGTMPENLPVEQDIVELQKAFEDDKKLSTSATNAKPLKIQGGFDDAIVKIAKAKPAGD